MILRKRSTEASSKFFYVTILFVALLMVAWVYLVWQTATATNTASTLGVVESNTGDAGARVLSSSANSNPMDDFYNIPAELRPPLQPFPPENELSLPYRKMYDLLKEWSPDDADIPVGFKETLQHFNYGVPEERAMAERWRNAELPFKIYNVSDFQAVSNKWNDEYLIKAIKGCPRRAHVERSDNNHFMFWSGRPSRIRGWKPPTEIITGMSFSDWLKLTKEADRMKLTNESEHFYFVMGAEAHENGRTFISRDIPMFSTETNNFWITNVAANKGIQCRFGMRGVVAASHYDAGKNFVAMLKGAKRYILNPPRACKDLAIISDTKHPSYRHSVIDWSDLSQAKQNHFDEVDAIDTIVHKGELLYIPSYWFHYIVSLNYSIQCNSRSGAPAGRIGWEHITKCFGQS